MAEPALQRKLSPWVFYDCLMVLCAALQSATSTGGSTRTAWPRPALPSRGRRYRQWRVGAMPQLLRGA